MGKGMRVRTFKSRHGARSADEHPMEQLSFPTGWFCVGFSREWEPGRLLTRPFMDSDIVVYRTRSGVLRAVRPFCPHLGAHLGAGGTVDGELLVCPFHRFAFAVDGSCSRTPYGKPPKASLDLLAVREAHGIVWVWHSPDGTGPTWELPELPAVVRAFRGVDLAGHPQDVMENFFDYAHLVELHRLDDVRLVSPPRTEGPFCSMTYRLGRNLLFFHPRQEITVNLLGLGAAYFVFSSAQLGVRAVQWMFATPTGPGRLRLWAAAHVTTDFAGRLPPALHRTLESVMSYGMNRWTLHDATPDFSVWHHKTYLPHPRLNDGDGPIGPFRHWARQFYPQEIPATP